MVTYTGRVQRLSARNGKFDTVKDLIKQNNAQSGIQILCSTSSSSSAPTVRLQALGVPNGETVPISDRKSDRATLNGDGDSRLRLKPVANTQPPPQIQSSHTPPVGPLRQKPVVQPKPEGLVGRVAALNGPLSKEKSTVAEADPLAERFAKLRSTNDANRSISHVAADPQPSSPAPRPLSPASFHEAYPPVTMPSPSDFVGSSSITSPFTSSQVNSPPHPTPPLRRPLGPRDMLPTRIGPPYPFETPLNTQFAESMPKAPSPTYSPARNLPTPANINPPRSTARSLVGTERRINLDNPTQTTALEIPTNVSKNTSYLPPPLGSTNGVAGVKRKPVELPREAEVTPEKLYNYLNRGSDQLSVLLIDVRDREDFDEGHIFSQSIICIEPIVLRPEMSADELEETLVLSPENEQNLFSRREKFDLVVYYDQSSTTNR